MKSPIDDYLVERSSSSARSALQRQQDARNEQLRPDGTEIEISATRVEPALLRERVDTSKTTSG